MDEVDRAQTEIEYALGNLVRKARRMAPPEPTECCLNCGAHIASGRRWCDPGCRDDWVRVNAGNRARR
jgi:hypothetical protein